MFGPGTAVYCPILDPFPGGLFYADFEDGAATDLKPPAAPFVLNGAASSSFGGGVFKPSNVGSTGAYVDWTAAKFAALKDTGLGALGWTIECRTSWATLPNATISAVMRIIGSLGNASFGYFSNGVTIFNISIGGVNSGVAVSPSTSHHWAVGSDGNFWLDGALAGNFLASIAVIGTCSSLEMGPVTYVGARDYQLEWFGATVGIKYTAPFTPPA